MKCPKLKMKKKLTKSGRPSKFEEAKHKRDKTGHFTFKLTKVADRSYNKKSVPLKTKISKYDTGKLGERLAASYMKKVFKLRTRTLNVKMSNSPIDLKAGKFLIEAKGGLISNKKGSRYWQANDGEMGELQKQQVREMTPEKRKAWYDVRKEGIIPRKYRLLAAMTRRDGIKYQPRTITTIINPDTKTFDVYVFKGYHRYVGWDSPLAIESFAGTFKYE